MSEIRVITKQKAHELLGFQEKVKKSIDSLSFIDVVKKP
jgi:hypothetical protein